MLGDIADNRPQDAVGSLAVRGAISGLASEDCMGLHQNLDRRRMTRLADWSVCFDPLELISLDGDVFTVEGWLIQSVAQRPDGQTQKS